MLIRLPIRRFEPPISLRLETVTFVQTEFVSKSDVVGSLTENVVINCGAMTLWNDLKAVPIKGQLAMLPSQPNLENS